MFGFRPYLTLAPMISDPASSQNAPVFQPNQPAFGTRTWGWQEAYRNDPEFNSYFDANGFLIDETRWHHERLWDGDLIEVPASKIPEVLEECHDRILSGHWGVSKTVNMLQRKYRLHNATKIVKQHIQTCDTCQRAKSERISRRGPIQLLDVPHRKWQSISVDWIVGFPLSHGKDCILTFTDRSTKMVHLQATSKQESAAQTAEFFLQNIVRYHGLPRSLIVDRDSRWLSDFWKALAEMLHIKMRPNQWLPPPSQWSSGADQPNHRAIIAFGTLGRNELG